MELGEKIRRARLAAGLSQRQLCGDEITRNMLSLIENGAAKPSMNTLAYLAERLGKPISWFVDENAENQETLLTSLENLRRAEEALTAGKDIYAAQLLEGVTAPQFLREKLLLSTRLPGADLTEICRALPSLDEELLLRAEVALISGQTDRCGHLLMAAEDQESLRWRLIMGRVHMARSEWAQAAPLLELAEDVYPEVVPMLEQCFREMGDFRRAYEYACKQKG